MTPNLPLINPFLTRTSTEGIPNQYRRNPPEISNLPASLYKPFPNYAKPCNTMHKQLIFCKGFRVKVYEGRFYEIQDCVNVLALNGVVLGFNHVLFIFFTRLKKTNQKKRRPRLGIFCLIRQKPSCQLRVATAPVLRSFLQLFWTEGITTPYKFSGVLSFSWSMVN